MALERMTGKKGRIRTLVAAGLLGSAVVATLVIYSYLPKTLIVAVESNTGDAVLLAALASQLSREHTSVRLQVREIPDESAVREALENGKAQLAVLRADLRMPIEGRAVAILRKNVLALITRSTSKIEDPSGLGGRRIGLVGPDVDSSQIMAVLAQYEIQASSWKAVRIDPANVRRALDSGEVDVVATAGPVTSQALADVVAAFGTGAKAPVFIPVSQSEAVAQRLPYYESIEIVAGTFGGNPPKPAENTETISFAHYLLAHSSLSDQTVAELTRRLFAARLRLATEFPPANLIAAASTAKDATVPAHPGAAAYFNDSEKSFFDRYGDWIYILAIVFSVLASAGVGLANYLGSARLRRKVIARRLATLINRANHAESSEALARIEREADTILTRAMVRVEAGTLPADALASFSLSNDLVRRAIAERRAALSSGVGQPTVRHASQSN